MQNLQNQDIDQHHGQQASASLNNIFQQFLSIGSNIYQEQITNVVKALVNKFAQSEQLNQQVLNEHRAIYDKLLKENKEQIEEQTKRFDKIITQNEKTLLDNQEQRKLYEKGLYQNQKFFENMLQQNQEFLQKILLDNQQERQHYQQMIEKVLDSQKKN
ncbi:hypothetical protein ABPG74_018435 [Tetrahymena malaccensis]